MNNNRVPSVLITSSNAIRILIKDKDCIIPHNAIISNKKI